MSILNETSRIGNFTSSQIFRLMGTAAVLKTYIQEKNIERRMGVSLKTESYSRDIAWGNFLEQRVLDLLGPEYQITSKITDVHPTIKCWTGTKDLVVEGKKISEIKCFQRKKFAIYTDTLLTRDTEIIKKNCPEEYWQLVSNAVILGLPRAEAITYMPYLSELDEIREMALNYPGDDKWKYNFIHMATNEELAHLPNGGYYKNLNVFEFKVPAQDIDDLTEAVKTNALQLITI